MQLIIVIHSCSCSCSSTEGIPLFCLFGPIFSLIRRLEGFTEFVFFFFFSQMRAVTSHLFCLYEGGKSILFFWLYVSVVGWSWIWITFWKGCGNIWLWSAFIQRKEEVSTCAHMYFSLSHLWDFCLTWMNIH